MRCRNILMLTAAVSISVIFALACSARPASQSLYAQNQGQAQAQAPPAGKVQGQNPAPGQGQNQAQQVNDRVRELQEQYKDLLKHEYNPSKYHPKATGEPSFSKPGWLNHSKPRTAKRVARSHAKRGRHVRKLSSHRRKWAGKSRLRRYSKKRTRTHAATRKRGRRSALRGHSNKRIRGHVAAAGRSARNRRAITRRSHKRLRRVVSKRVAPRRASSRRHSVVKKSKSSRRAPTRRGGRTIMKSAKKAIRGRRSLRAAHGRKGAVKRKANKRKWLRKSVKSHRVEKKHKK